MHTLSLLSLPLVPTCMAAPPQAGWRLSLTNMSASLVGITSTTLASTYGSATLAAHVIGTQVLGSSAAVICLCGSAGGEQLQGVAYMRSAKYFHDDQPRQHHITTTASN